MLYCHHPTLTLIAFSCQYHWNSNKFLPNHGGSLVELTYCVTYQTVAAVALYFGRGELRLILLYWKL